MTKNCPALRHHIKPHPRDNHKAEPKKCVTNQSSYLISQVPKTRLAYHNAVMILCSCVCALLEHQHNICPVPLPLPSVLPKTPQACSFFSTSKPPLCLPLVGSFLLGGGLVAGMERGENKLGPRTIVVAAKYPFRCDSFPFYSVGSRGSRGSRGSLC